MIAPKTRLHSSRMRTDRCSGRHWILDVIMRGGWGWAETPSPDADLLQMQIPLHMQTPLWRQTPFIGRPPFRGSTPVDRQTLLKTLPSLAVGKNVCFQAGTWKHINKMTKQNNGFNLCFHQTYVKFLVGFFHSFYFLQE